MRLAASLSEAWRNVISGTTSALLFALAFVIMVGGVAANDVLSVVRGIRSADMFLSSGAAITVVSGPSAVDGAACEALNSSDGIRAAGAVRRTKETVKILAMPSSNLPLFEATPSLTAILSASANGDAGVWLPEQLARTVGAQQGVMLVTATGETPVAGTYLYPEDGRKRDLAYAVISPVPPQGLFDECWVLIWPQGSDAEGLITMAVADPDADIKYSQLNTTLGTEFEREALLSGRPTALTVWIVPGIGFALGYISSRRRRLEIASNLHAGIPKSNQILQIGMETSVWAVAGVIVASPVLAYLAWLGNPGETVVPWVIGMREVLAGGFTAILGGILGAMQAREKHLFSYFKQR